MSFTLLLREEAGRRRIPLPPGRHPEPLAALRYTEELSLKQDALAALWRTERLPGRLERILAAPSPRGYRTTTKRRAAYRGGNPILTFPGAGSSRSRRGSPGPFLATSALDLPEHEAVYAFLLERLARPTARYLAAVLNWVVIRGSAGGLAVIFNLNRFDARVVRTAKQIGEALQQAPLGVRAGFLYLDPTQSEYYLEARRPEGGVSFKRLFGPTQLQVEVGPARLRYPPTVFSQVNAAMLDDMIGTARALLEPLEGRRLLDLYCGYGLFSLTVGRAATHVTGLDSDGPAIMAARTNAANLGDGDRTRFLTRRIDEASLIRLGREAEREAREPEIILLDPPRQGTAPGVTRALAARSPARVLHLCCGTDEIPREIAGWSQAGYHVQRVVPLDLFAGTESLETMLVLAPTSVGSAAAARADHAGISRPPHRRSPGAGSRSR